eukprot:4323295-Alexandrium_andersonii.AAC.1
MDDPTPARRYLGRGHVAGERASPVTGKRVRALEYDMPEFVGQRVEVHCQQFDVDKARLPKRKVGAPFAGDVKKFVMECG